MTRLLDVAGSLLRIGLAAGVVWLCINDLPRVQAVEALAQLPDYDYWKEGEKLLDQRRFSEALLVVDAGLRAAPPVQAPALRSLRDRIEVERSSWLVRLQQAGQGALSGRGESPEALGGAIVADLFVFGDVRDLVIQGGHALRGEATDPVLVALSAGGILLTVSPALDFGSALLKFARRMGAMTERFAGSLLRTIERAVQRQNADELLQVTADAAELARRARPAGAVTILRSVDDPAELRRAALFAQQEQGAFTLWLGGR
ncbi:MAG TPA: hypothetical protein VM369_02990, partial [Candidatus Binatia bacterium]|nr:hypothetical protein [Candidatus Binatia bacterium]